MTRTTSKTPDQLIATVLIKGPGQDEVQKTVDPDAGLLIGSDESCCVVLNAPSVAARHCMLQLNGEILLVTDWYSATGTWVNGEKIYAETRLGESDTLTVGPYTFRLQLIRNSPPEMAEPDKQPESDSPIADLMTLVDEPTPADLPNHQANDPSTDVLQQMLDESQDECRRLARELEFQKSLASIRKTSESPYEEFDEGEAGILRAEIEHLQAELMQRDTEIAELLARGYESEPEPQEVNLDESDTARLVTRLEQLLDELQYSDERVRTLENLLQISEEATVAEKAERTQLSQWVSEIESRVADREQQWRSTQDRLEESLLEATRRYERAEENIRRVAEADVHELQRDLQIQISELTERNSKLMNELSETRSKLATLDELVSQSGMSNLDLENLNARQAEIRQNEIQMAQDRALIARQRAEIAGLRDELEKATSESTADSIDNPDQRIRQFRAHLREIHETEQEEKRQRSLGARISRLFKRLDEK